MGRDPKIVASVGDILQTLLPFSPGAMRVRLDADSESTPLEQFTKIHQELTRLQL